MANALEIRNQGASTLSHKTPVQNRCINRCEMLFLAAGAVAGHAAVLADLDRTREDFDLLDDPRQFVAGLDASAAIGAGRQAIVPRLVDLIDRKRRSLVTRVAWLGSSLALASSLGGRLRRLDDIAGRGLEDVDEFFLAAASSASSFSRCAVSSAIFSISSAQRGLPPVLRLSMMNPSYRLTRNQPRAILGAVNGYRR